MLLDPQATQGLGRAGPCVLGPGLRVFFKVLVLAKTWQVGSWQVNCWAEGFGEVLLRWVGEEEGAQGSDFHARLQQHGHQGTLSLTIPPRPPCSYTARALAVQRHA